MTNLRTDEMVFCRNLTKIDTDENKAIYNILDQKKKETIPNYHLSFLT